MYETRKVILYNELVVNKCPHCDTESVVLVIWGQNATEQVGPTIYCYMCGKRFDDALETHTMPKA